MKILGTKYFDEGAFFKKRIRALYFIFLVILLSPVLISAQENTGEYEISHISSERIFVNAGKDKGLEKGDSLFVVKKNVNIAYLLVLHVSSHSSSCKILDSKAPVAVGMAVKKYGKEVSKEENKALLVTTRKRPLNSGNGNRYKRSRNKISGDITVSNFSFMENKGEHSIHQPGIRFKLKVRELFQDLDKLEIYFRSRYYYRTGYGGYAAPNEEWRNRLYSFSYRYTDPGAKVNYSLGRFSSNVVSGIGFIDGGQFQYALSESFKTGVFAGAVSTELFSTIANPASLQKYGVYAQYNYKGSSTNWLTVLSATGEYHGSLISREFLFMKNSFSLTKLINVYHSMEIDVNRDWRKKNGMDGFSLSNFFLKLDYWFIENNRVSIRYDNRKNYYTYDNQSIPDSLFDSAMRQGMRLSYSGRYGKYWNLRIFGGFRNAVSGDQASYSYGFSVNKRNLFFRSLSAVVSFNSVSNIYTEGYNPNLKLYKSWDNGLITGVGGGGYWYKSKQYDNEYKQYWVDLFINGNLFRRTFFSIDLEYLQNNDMDSYRMNIQLGYRF